ncbi:lipopolysaccharide biosynthesis protein [Fusobacterium ulcerans]|uniref:lipopolysaccharide biosynthesis protein n=1 Tax=Fusobacterium ulcerans TaxID=861 RepID=UPI001D09E41C|nr:oligosaccharide flippase family protein [Fusobacterium ulcerans]MCB8566202.1 oligosaccharide flippase family protein [Fusobacterium ulcerans]MCB8650287.1 oligosaccharide flippase family protein [Fusobacterium ulcerans]
MLGKERKAINKKFIRGIYINFIITFVTSLFSFIINKYFANYMGIEKLGLMKLFTQIMAYLNLVDMGIASASTYALYEPLYKKNIERISIIINTITSLYNKIFFFILIIGLLINPIIPFFIKDSTFSKEIYLYWSLYVINTAITYLFVKYSILFTANQEFLYVRAIQGMSKIFYQILQIIVIIKIHSFFLFIFLLILDNITQYIFYKYHYKKYYSHIVKTHEKDKNISKNLKNLFWHKIGGLVVFNTDLILISKFISLEIVGIYASYQMIEQMILTILSIILNVLRPMIGKYIAIHTKEETYDYWKKLNISFLLISIVFSYCTYYLINGFVSLWLGRSYILSDMTVLLICINLFIRCFRGVTDIFKDGSGFFDDIHLPIAEAAINFESSLILVFYLGINGVIIGTILSNVLIICIAKPLLVFKRCFNKDYKKYIKVYGNYLLLIMFSLILSKFLLNYIPILEIYTWVDWLKKAVLITSIISTITLVIFLFSKDFRESIAVIRRK